VTGLSKERIELFRASPPGLRAELLAQIEQDVTGLSRTRLHRIAQILERRVFRGEAPHTICLQLKVSRQQFYADLREGVRRLNSLVDRNKSRSTAIVIENPREAIIAQARAAYHAGMSQRSFEMLERLHPAPLRPSEMAELTGLELEVREDLMLPFASLQDGVELVRAARLRADAERASDDDRALLDATAHWLQTHLSCYGTDRQRFLREYDTMTALLRPRAFAGNRDAALAFCRFTLAALLMLDSFSLFLDGSRAERALKDVEALLRLRDDMPAAFLASLHARYATFYSGKAAQAHRFREERASAYRMGIERSSTLSVWFALAMEVPQSLALGETTHALTCASALYGSVRASESAEWQTCARMMLAHALNAADRFEEAQEFIPIEEAFSRPSHPHVTLPACETLLGLRRYRECVELATLLANSINGVHRASALILRAKAGYYGGDSAGAMADIKDAIAMFDSIRGHTFYALCSAYRTAHLITQEKRYRDMLCAIETMLEDDAPATPLIGEERGLTARQRVIAGLAAKGETNNGIAQRLNISPRTVKNSFNAIYARLGIRARWQLADALERTPHAVS
jgi:DNA-binding CsgD family transcriptional regulator